MIKNYLKVAFRNILKHKFFSAINIVGMSIGLTACLLIIIYVADELSYDNFHTKADRMYQVGLHGKIAGQEVSTANTCPPMAAALVSDIPEIEEATRIAPYFGQAIVKYEEKSFIETKVFFVDSNFFEFFSYRLKEGDLKTALKEPNTVVITDVIAKKYFGNEQAVGKLMNIGDNTKTYKVTGIAEASPTNSHFSYEMLVSAKK